MKKEVKDRLNKLMPGRVQFNAGLAPLTTFRLGGPAAALAEPDSMEELTGLLEVLRQSGQPWFILGGGSNVLFRDGGFKGVVLRLGRHFSKVTVTGADGPDVFVEAGAAAPTASLVRLCRRQGLAGLEFLAGIPGWIGGALAMNAGAQSGQICQAVTRIDLMTPDQGLLALSGPDIKAVYRSLELPEGAVILKAAFRLKQSRPEAVEALVRDILARRRAGQPQGVRSAGCIFRNPVGDAAGRLIDQAGLKGRRQGQAWVAREHANFIVHRGQARSEDVVGLVETVRSEVKARFGVDLEPEIKIVGSDVET